MGIGIVLLFWALVGGITMAFYVLSRNRSKKIAKIISGAILAPIAFLLLVVSINYFQSLFPSRIFESSFGFPPTTDVAELKGESSTFGDSSSVVLRFRANKQTVVKILGSRFAEIDKETFRLHSAVFSSPDNWRSLESKTTRYYKSDNFDESYGSSSAVLSYDESLKLAHFYWIGID